MIRAAFRVLAVLALVAILGMAWLYLPGDGPVGVEMSGASSEDVPASAPMERIRAMMEGETTEVALESAELAALLGGPLAGHLPSGVGAPLVAVHQGRVRIVLPIPLESALPLSEVPVVAGFIPDTVRATVTALVSSADGSFTVHVERLALGRVPIPGFLVSSIARRLDVGGGSGEPLTWPLPPGLAALYIDGDRLVLRADR